MPVYKYIDDPTQLQYCGPELEIKEIFYEDVIDEFTIPQNINGQTVYTNQRSVLRKPRFLLQEDPEYTEQLTQIKLKELQTQLIELKIQSGKLIDEHKQTIQINQNLTQTIQSTRTDHNIAIREIQLRLETEQNKNKDLQKIIQTNTQAIEKVKLAIGEIQWNQIIGNTQELPQPGERQLEI